MIREESRDEILEFQFDRHAAIIFLSNVAVCGNCFSRQAFSMI